MNISMRRLVVGSLVLAVGGMASSGCLADEGMWLLNNPPLEAIKTKYNVTLTPAWLEHAQKAAVNVGASGSFVSRRGLVMTNHHVASDAIQKLSTPERDLMKNGFYAATLEQELKCPDTDVQILMEIRDVTARVNETGGNERDVLAERQRNIAAIEKEATEATKLKCRVITLYGGAQYHLYCWKKFTDVRLVFAPEFQAAFFGGDADNFEYPRYNLDCTFLRVYENDKPYEPANYFLFSKDGVKEGEPIFVVGHPGRTQRLLTIDDLRYARDVELPTRLASIWRMESKIREFMGRSATNAMLAREESFGWSNSRKALTGQLEGLQDPAVWQKKVAEYEAVTAGRTPAAQKARQAAAKLSRPRQLARQNAAAMSGLSRGMPGELGRRALQLVVRAEQLQVPSADRLSGYRDTALEGLDHEMMAEVPIHAAFEQAQLEWWLSMLVEKMGGEDPFVRNVLDGHNPAELARLAVSGSRLETLAERKALIEGGRSAVEASADSMIQLARRVAGEYIRLERLREFQIEPEKRDAYAAIGAARFEAMGSAVYPDATGTLRISYGAVAGYQENGKRVEPFTQIGGMFERAAKRSGEEDFALPMSWAMAKGKLDQKVPFNFVCTADIIGGNSGSPVLNARGEVVGLIFDGNLASLPGAFVYDMERNRAIAVDVRAIVHAARVIYGASALADELEGK